MKKSLLLITILLAFNMIFAAPVDMEHAKYLGQKFVKANFTQNQNANLELAEIVRSESGEACFYVFNVEDHGFIFVSATDLVRPILGYSENGAFNEETNAPGLTFMMGEYKDAISYAIDNVVAATPDIVAEWKSLENIGKLKSASKGAVAPLCTTKWNQSWPYNAYCPEQSASWASNGHVVVGCVATAMAQIMKYWDHPVQGQGSHSYYAQLYGQQTANFGETTYDWANMPNSLSSSSPQVEIDAVAILSYHCGVAVDMMYDVNGTGSGAYSTDVPGAIQSYFRYAPANYTSKGDYQAWLSMLKEAIDMRRPVYYSGQSTGGGHAFVCDGYDDNELFHFNYGWGGSSDGYFAPDAIEYNTSVGAIFNMMPLDVYNNTAKAPTNFTVVPTSQDALSATISWTNPSQTMNNSAITTIEKMVVERDGQIIHIEENTAAGAQVTFVDDQVPCFSQFDYQVYALIEDAHGAIAKVENVAFGPTCEWSLMLQSSVFQGMRGAYVSVYDAAGARIGQYTTTNSSVNNFDIDMPISGPVSFSWSAPTSSQGAYDITIIIKNSDNQSVYQYDGSTDEMSVGVFYKATEICGDGSGCNVPSNLIAAKEGDNIALSWDAVDDYGYGYNIYRDGILYRLVQENTFVDADLPVGGHCYTISTLCENGASAHSNEACAVATEGCEPAMNLWYELTSNMKPKIYWDAPENENLSGYYIFRKTNEDGEWSRIKLLGANKIDYTDNSALQEGNWYYYRVQAFYQDNECLSAPATSKYDDTEYFIKVYYSTTAIGENTSNSVKIFPNPANENITIQAKGIKNISIVNLMGQKVFETSLYSDEVVLNMSDIETGMYIIRITTDELEMTERISIVH